MAAKEEEKEMNTESHSPEDNIPLPSEPLLTEEESSRQVRDDFTRYAKIPFAEQLDTAEAEIARLQSIIGIQQKQIERLLAARDIEKARADELEGRIANALI